MEIRAFGEQLGYEKLKQVGRRLFWTCGALTVGNVIAPLFFRNFNVKAHVFLGVVEGATFQLMLNNRYFKCIDEKFVEFFPEREARMKKMARVVQFTLLTMTPFFLAKGLTSRFFEEITRGHMIKMGVFYNGAIAIASAYGYNYWDKTLSES